MGVRPETLAKGGAVDDRGARLDEQTQQVEGLRGQVLCGAVVRELPRARVEDVRPERDSHGILVVVMKTLRNR
jgi:hypothetical protein